MKRPIISLSIILLVAALVRFYQPDQPTATSAELSAAPVAESISHYTEGTASVDGIGKFFHGREISKVMGHPAIGWLEREDREQEEAPSLAIDALPLPPNTVIADIGAGSGYYTFRIAPKIPFGKVIAIDIQPEMLTYLEKKSAELKVNNVTTHLGAIDDLKLEPGSLDAALMVDAYHEFSHPDEMLKSLFTALKPGGKLYLVEYRGEDDGVPIKPLHKMTAAQAKLEIESSGLRFVSNSTVLPWQHLMTFERPLTP
jgi:SAM-dependent methyltransferase